MKAADGVPGLRCVGIEIDESLAARGRDRIPDTLVDRVEIRNSDVLKEMDVPRGGNERRQTLLNDATAVFVYLLPDGLRRIRLLLDEAAKRRRATTNSNDKLRVASYLFSIPDWNPVTVDRSAKGGCPIYLYEI